MDHELGHSQHHSQNVGFQGYRSNRALDLDRTQPQAPHQILSLVSHCLLLWTPPLLLTQPRENEPFPHQIRPIPRTW